MFLPATIALTPTSNREQFERDFVQKWMFPDSIAETARKNTEEGKGEYTRGVTAPDGRGKLAI